MTQIETALMDAGAFVRRMEPAAGFDLLVIAPRGVHIVKIIDGGRWQPTQAEAETKRQVEQSGGAYFVVETVEEALGLVLDDLSTILSILGKEIQA